MWAAAGSGLPGEYTPQAHPLLAVTSGDVSLRDCLWFAEDFTRTRTHRPGTSTDVNRPRASTGASTGEFNQVPTTKEETAEEVAEQVSQEKNLNGKAHHVAVEENLPRDMSTNAMSADVDSLMTSQTELEQGRALRLP